MKICFLTLGCKVNQYETVGLRELFMKDTNSVTNKISEADVVVINSCSVTAESDRKTRQLVRRCRRTAPNAVLVLAGCMAQVATDLLTALPEVDLVVGNRELGRVPRLVETFLQDKIRRNCVLLHTENETYQTPPITTFPERTRAYMKIEDGCDRYCSYCIIPFARGHVRSRSLCDIQKEAQKLAASGYNEIVLVGINLSAYGHGETFDLCDAVATVCNVDGIKRVRLGSLEPDHITDTMLEKFKEQEKFCPQFHLSLQSGSDGTLKRMNRHYDSAFYFDLVERIRAVFPDASITTDVMVGFAGETQEEFDESYCFVEKIGFAKTHVFVYSKRQGTFAATLQNQVAPSVAEERSRKMIALTDRLEQEFYEKQCGMVFPVLFETAENGAQEGFTPNYTRVRVETDEALTGQIKNVFIERVENGVCIGKLIP